MSRGLRWRIAAVVLLAAGMSWGGAAAEAAMADDPTFNFDSPTLNITYGQGWYFQATANNAPGPSFWEAVDAELLGAPAGYSTEFGSFKVDELTVVATIYSTGGQRPLAPGSYTATITLGEQEGLGAGRVTTAPATLNVAPAPLGIDLRIGADPSNAANAIVAASFTGDFVQAYFTSEDPESGLSPAGTWTITVSDADGNAVHEFTSTREAGDDVLAVSSYWSDVPPGAYTARATFTPSGESAENFTITQPSPVNFAAAQPPGAVSTAPPAPPTAPESESGGMTLPIWIPVVVGAVTAGLIALTVVQIIRLRRSGRLPSATKEVAT